MTATSKNHAEQRTADPSKLPESFTTAPAPYDGDVVDTDGDKTSHVFGAGVEQGAAPLYDEAPSENLHAIVEKFPSRDTIVGVYADVSLTFERFYNQVLRLASTLTRTGHRPRDCIGVWSINRWEWTMAQYTCHHIGPVLVNINPARRQHELNYVPEKTGVCMVFAARRYRDPDYRTMLIEASKQRGMCLNKVVYSGFSEWYEHMRSEIDDLSEYTPQLKPDDPIDIQFTSGTTGFSKGATLTHRNLLDNGYFTGELLGCTETDCICMPMLFFYTFGMVIGAFVTLTHGTAIVIPVPLFKARETLRVMHSAKATNLYGMLTMFISEPEEAHGQEEYDSPYDLSMLRTGVIAGTPCPSKIMRDVMDKSNMREIAIYYSVVETSPVFFRTHADSPLEKRVNTAGQIMPHLEVRTICKETDEMLLRGEQGEAIARGHLAMKEYWGRPGKTAKAIGTDGWMHAGDLGVLDDEGHPSIAGRIKDMPIRGGEDIYSHEVGGFLFAHLAVIDAQVIDVPDDKYGEEIIVWVILHDDVKDLTAEDVATFAHGRLLHHRIPHYVHVIEEFPVTASDKVRKVETHGMIPRILGWMQNNVKSN